MSAAHGPLSPPPVTEWRPDYRPAYLSNGLLGLRVGHIPMVDGLCMVDGLVELDPVEDGEGFARAPYPLWGDVVVDGHGLVWHPEQARLIEQAYDFATGELRTRFAFRPASVEARVEHTVFCSRSLPTLAVHEVRVEVDAGCHLVVTGGLNPSGLTGRWVARRTRTPGTDIPIVDGLMEWETSGALSTCGAAYATTFHGADHVERRIDDIDQRAPLRTSYAFAAHPGRTYVLRQISSLLSSRMHTEPDRMAARMTYLGATNGFEQVRRENRAAWAELWKGRPVLRGGDERWQGIVDASFYYLHASAHRSSIFSTAMFGLAYWPDYHYYRGHVMWDIEGFAVPVFVLTDPDIARALLGYRLDRLDAARRNAAMNGYAGLQFPWAASAVHGEEVIRLSKARVIFEQHVNMVVAYAFARYCHATGDDAYLREHAWHVLSGVASWIQSRGVDTARGFEIHDCLGIAEQEMPADNHAYVNMASAVVLREAAAAARRMGLPGADVWEGIADRMYLPVDEAANVILNHDGYRYRGDVASSTPETLMGLFPFTYRPAEERENATLRFYLDRAGPYVGSPMLSAPLGAWAAHLGDRALSGRMFEEGYADFVDEPYRVTNEFSTRFPDEVRAGPLMANVGGFLISVLYGLTGLEPGPDAPDSWARRPATMPDLWDGIDVARPVGARRSGRREEDDEHHCTCAAVRRARMIETRERRKTWDWKLPLIESWLRLTRSSSLRRRRSRLPSELPNPQRFRVRASGAHGAEATTREDMAVYHKLIAGGYLLGDRSSGFDAAVLDQLSPRFLNSLVAAGERRWDVAEEHRAEPGIGFRAFKIRSEGGRQVLRALASDACWHPTAHTTATCLKLASIRQGARVAGAGAAELARLADAHGEAPNPHCECGLYVLNDPLEVERWIDYSHGQYVVAMVMVGGTLIRHGTQGVRARYAKPVAFFGELPASTRAGRFGRDLAGNRAAPPEVVEGLVEQYGIPYRPLRLSDERAIRWIREELGSRMD